MNITVAGTGYVGLVAGVCFAEVGHKVLCTDTDGERIKLLNDGICPIYEKGLEELLKKNLKNKNISFTENYKKAYEKPDAIFIGVGTPEKEDGSAELGYISAVSKQIAENLKQDCLIVVKSTVPVGTNDMVEKLINDFLVSDVKIDVASNPEFLSQGSAVNDMMNAQRIIIGTKSKSAENMLREIYKPFKSPIVCVGRRSAEMIKYASNSFLALKISYMNDIANLCEAVDADITEVAKGMSYDERIGKKFLKAGIGFGGSCFPKDTKALIYLAEKNNIHLKTVEGCVHVNENQKNVLYKKACERFLTLSRLNISVLGVTFKPGTDDLRESPASANIRKFLNDGANVKIYDPAGMENARKIFPEGNFLNGKTEYSHSAKEALSGSDVCFIFTEWEEFMYLTPDDFLENMRRAVIFDGRNIFDSRKMELNGVEYHSIGRK